MIKIYIGLVFFMRQIKKHHLSFHDLLPTIPPYLMIGNSLQVNEFQT